MKLNPVLSLLVLALVVFILGVLLFNYILMPVFVHQHGTVTVPELSGMSEKQASQVLARRSLEMKVKRREYSNEIPAGYVISQTPRRDDRVKEGRVVEVILSLGTRMQAIPDLAGLSLRQGRIMLKRHHLAVGRVAKRIVEGNARESIIATYPGAGKEIVEGGKVDVLVAVGGRKHRYLMPDLTGQDLFFIKGKLEKMGFRVASVRYEYRAGVYPNTIIGQTPASGSQIGEGDSIELVAATTD
jgi:serine/threonine-protein kinase